MTTRPRIAVVGPTVPYKGGIVQHTTVLAHTLAASGADVELVGWRRQYPKALYPGQLTVAEPDTRPFPATTRPLSWNRPDTWWRTGRRLRGADAVLVAVVTPLQLVFYRVLLAALGKGPRRIAVVHNVLPHERSRSDERLVRGFLRAVHTTVVHTQEQAEVAAALGAPGIRTVPLPATTPSARERSAPARDDAEAPLDVLAVGLVRPYKGLDLLIRAAAEVPQVRVTIAGEIWGDPDELPGLARTLGIADRVEVRPGYVPTADLDALFARHHLVALPYRSATGSANIKLALDHGVPVVVTDVGDFAAAVADGSGIVCAPEDVAALADALRTMCEPERYAEAVAAVGSRPVTYEDDWARYAAEVKVAAGANP